MKKKTILSLIAVLAMTGLFTACGNGNSNNEAEAGNGVVNEAENPENSGTDDAEEIKIGINYELTGEVASYGQSSVDGIMMAFDEINEAGGVDGKKIVPVQIDNKSDPAEATSVATRLMTQEKVVAELGPATSGSFMATIPVAMQNKVPIISASATADDGVTVDDKGNVNEYVFRLCFNDSFQGITMANFAFNNLEAKTAVIIKDNSSDYGKGLAENFRATFENLGGQIVAEEGYVGKDKDFNAVLTKIKGQDFDVIFIPGYYQEAGLIIKQARDLGIDAPVLGADGFDSPVLLDLAGADALNDVYYSNHYSSLDEDPKVQEFIAGYKEKYGAEPNAFNALGYDLGKYIADAVSRAGSPEPEAIKEALKSTKGFQGITGTFDMDEQHNPVKSAIVIGLENGVQSTTVTVEPK